MLPIWDNSGSENTPIDKVWDNNGTSSSIIDKVWDHDGSSGSLILSPVLEIFNPASVTWQIHEWSAETPSLSSTLIRVYCNGTSNTNSVAYCYANLTGYSKLYINAKRTIGQGNASTRIHLGTDRWPWLGSELGYVDIGNNGTYSINLTSSRREFFICAYAWGSTGQAGMEVYKIWAE